MSLLGKIISIAAAALLTGCGADRVGAPGRGYEAVVSQWRSIEDVNTWIGANFRYDKERAIRLSETQRARQGGSPILEPGELFERPTGVCVDLARFGYETGRRVEPGLALHYLMIEFEPIQVGGESVRRHWVVVFERNGHYFVFADSNRPGEISGPYTSLGAFAADYERLRGRRIVRSEMRDSYKARHKKQMRRLRPG